MIAKVMRDTNFVYNIENPYDSNKPFAEQDIRFAEFIDWLNTQEQAYQDVVTIAMQFAVAFYVKFSPLEHTDTDAEQLKRVEDAQERLGIDFLYPLEGKND